MNEGTKLIPLTKGKFAIVDAADCEELSKFKWHFNRDGCAYRQLYLGCVSGKRKTKLIGMHRQILNAPKGMEVDHINFDRLDNRRCNLRICTRGENQCNLKPRLGTSSKYKGVNWRENRGKWRAYINKNGIRHTLGVFTDEKQAAMAYNMAALRLHGEFARLNMIA